MTRIAPAPLGDGQPRARAGHFEWSGRGGPLGAPPSCPELPAARSALGTAPVQRRKADLGHRAVAGGQLVLRGRGRRPHRQPRFCHKWVSGLAETVQ